MGNEGRRSSVHCNLGPFVAAQGTDRSRRNGDVARSQDQLAMTPTIKGVKRRLRRLRRHMELHSSPNRDAAQIRWATLAALMVITLAWPPPGWSCRP